MLFISANAYTSNSDPYSHLRDVASLIMLVYGSSELSSSLMDLPLPCAHSDIVMGMKSDKYE
jgi:hypothetical protein